ncbi:MAG: hypothetical protein IKW04_05025 [Clostridia bacterium]|nr:hypothetical protein [Clostridia bacterium]
MFLGKSHLEELRTNVYLIPERIREIDEEYCVVRNLKDKRFELHHLGQFVKTGNSFCLVIPYSELDARAVEFVNRTSIRNRDLQRELRKMEEENEKKKAKKEADLKEQTTREATEILKFCHNSSRDWID